MTRPILKLKKPPPKFPSGKKTLAVVEFLRAKWPLCFTTDPAPLKIGIQNDILAALELNKRQKNSVGNALSYLTRSTAYLKAVESGAARIDLDGNSTGEPTPEHREAARVKREAAYDQYRTKRLAEALPLDRERESVRAAKRAARQAATAAAV
jgi:sRNA-binding protein